MFFFLPNLIIALFILDYTFMPEDTEVEVSCVAYLLFVENYCLSVIVSGVNLKEEFQKDGQVD